jgi:hypothetical protein
MYAELEMYSRNPAIQSLIGSLIVTAAFLITPWTDLFAKSSTKTNH